MTRVRFWALLTLLCLGHSTALAAEKPAWPCYQGPSSNFSATDCGLTLVADLKDARLVWKSVEPTPPGAAQSPRYGGHAWHRISLGDFKPVKIPLADGGEVVSGGGIPLPGGGASSLLGADGSATAALPVTVATKTRNARAVWRSKGMRAVCSSG